jgi:predicted PurR-regulated permease PerM
MFFIIYYNIFFKEKEGFNINDINNMFNDVKNITKVVGEVPQQINKIDNKLTEQVNNLEKTLEKKTEEMGKKIQENTVEIFTKKLGNIFIQLGDIFNNGIVKPILAVFFGIGNIFTQVFSILQEITNKIVSLPNCIFTYAIASTINTFYFFYEKIIPKFLKNIFSSIYYYTFRYLFNFIGYITGYDDNYQKCYGFNVSSEVDKMNSNLNKIQSSFKNDFGRLNFSQIKI